MPESNAKATTSRRKRAIPRVAGRVTRIGLAETDALENPDGADLLTEVSRGIDQWRWLVGAHQRREPITGSRR